VEAIVIGDNGALEARDLERPAPAPGEVVIDVEYCGICGTDLKFVGSSPPPFVFSGMVPGHEVAGAVAALAEDVRDWQVGDRVTISPALPCGDCPPCRTGHESCCERGGVRQVGPGLGQRRGGYAEALAVPAGMLRRLPDSVSTRAGALSEPLAVGVRSVSLALESPAEAICVLGAGPIGLLAAIAARARGVRNIVIVDPKPGRRGIAAELAFATATPESAGAAFASLEGGLTAAIDCSGHPTGVPLALELLAVGGRLVVTGIPPVPTPVSLRVLAVKEITIRGTFGYSNRDFSEALQLLASPEFPADRLITAVVPLDEAGKWFDELHDPATEQVKVLLRP
jgi:2-desacetyl-2-hydroxyethyl bacteriochlorophyllide A dehydrogenase